MTRVRGLAPSRRLSSFCNNNKLCDRAWVFEVGAMLRLGAGHEGYRRGWASKVVLKGEIRQVEESMEFLNGLIVLSKSA